MTIERGIFIGLGIAAFGSISAALLIFGSRIIYKPGTGLIKTYEHGDKYPFEMEIIDSVLGKKNYKVTYKYARVVQTIEKPNEKGKFISTVEYWPVTK